MVGNMSIQAVVLSGHETMRGNYVYYIAVIPTARQSY